MTTRKTKKVIADYILKKGDICCENNIDRKLAIEDIFEVYTKIADFMHEKDKYLDYVQNDLLVFIGFRMMLEDTNKEGVQIWDAMKKRTEKGGVPNKMKIIQFLQDVPLFYLMAFLGNAHYIHRRNKAHLSMWYLSFKIAIKIKR